MRNLIQKHKQILLYLIAGAISTFVSISIQYSLAYFLKWPVAINTSISWTCAVTCAFFLNKLIVFNAKTTNKKETAKQALKFFSARIMTYILEITFMCITVDILNQNEYIMKIIIQIIIIVLNYILSKFIVFNKKK